MDARQIQVYRGAMLLLAHKEKHHELIDSRDITTAVTVAHEVLGVVEGTVKPFGPVDTAKSFDTAA